MSMMTRQKELNFKPGERHVYSNTGYTLMGLIVKRVSGMTLREFTTKNIFLPLGMTHTHFRDDHAEILKHNAVGYEQELGKPFEISITNFDTVGATSLQTTVEDLQLWDENFYHPKLGGDAFVQQMLERGKLNNGEQLDYAFGLVLGKYKGLPTVDHAGGDAGYRSDMTRFPEQHFSVAVLCNSAETDPSGLVRQVADIVLATEIKAAKVATPAKEAVASTAANPAAAMVPTAEQTARFTGCIGIVKMTRSSECSDKPLGPSGHPLSLQTAGERQGLARSRKCQPRELPQSCSPLLSLQRDGHGHQRRVVGQSCHG